MTPAPSTVLQRARATVWYALGWLLFVPYAVLMVLGGLFEKAGMFLYFTIRRIDDRANRRAPESALPEQETGT